MLKRLLITGGTGGLGTAVAEVFRKGGWEATVLSSEDLDLLDRVAVESFFKENPCDLLVCAAGIIRDVPLARMEEGAWDEVFRVNFTAARNCALAVLPWMALSGRGHVVFVSSYAAVHPAVGQAAYATAKAALLGLTKDLAERFGKDMVRVNAVLPGFLETPMTAAVGGKRKAVVRDSHFMKEFNTPGAAAEFLRFLDERMPFTSGQVFHLDSRP